MGVAIKLPGKRNGLRANDGSLPSERWYHVQLSDGHTATKTEYLAYLDGHRKLWGMATSGYLLDLLPDKFIVLGEVNLEITATYS